MKKLFLTLVIFAFSKTPCWAASLSPCSKIETGLQKYYTSLGKEYTDGFFTDFCEDNGVDGDDLMTELEECSFSGIRSLSLLPYITHQLKKTIWHKRSMAEPQLPLLSEKQSKKVQKAR